MPPNSESEGGDRFQNLAATIERLRAAAMAPPPVEEKKSWRKKTTEPPAQEKEHIAAVVEALHQLLGFVREAAENQTNQEKRLAQIEEEMGELRELSTKLDAFRQNAEGTASELRGVAANVRGLHERAAMLETALAQAREEAREQARQAGEQARLGAEQAASSQGDLRREFQERLQHLLDEQRVCLRQLSLQASEEAVLADRARRAVELKLEELANRVPPPAA